MIITNFYESIMGKLTTNIADIKHFDLYFKQDEEFDEKGELPFLRSAVLLEYEPIDWETYGNRKKAANIIFNLHVISDVIQEVDKRTTLAIRNKGHEHKLLLDKIDAQLQGFNGSGFNSISSKGVIPYLPNGMMIKDVMRFGTRITNDAAVKVLFHPNPQPDSSITVINETP